MRKKDKRVELLQYAMKHMAVSWGAKCKNPARKFGGEIHVEVKITEFDKGVDVGLKHNDAVRFCKNDAIDIIESISDKKFGNSVWTIDSIAVSMDGDLEDTSIRIEADLYIHPAA